MKVLHLIDRSRVVAREECPRMRYWGYDYDETGVDTVEGSLPLLSGIAIHAAHARLLGGEPVEQVAASVVAAYVAEIEARGLAGIPTTPGIIAEQAALLEGMLRVWHAVRLPAILDEYDVESIEQRWDWELAPGLVQRLRMDAILTRRDDGLRFILDYKGMGYASEFFLEKQEHDKQTCLYIQALKERTGEPVGGILYEGLIRGPFRKDTALSSPFYGQRIQHSPYTLAYALRGEAGTLYQTDYTSKKGWQKVQVFKEMPVKTWVEDYLLQGKPQELFVVVPPISPPDYELQREKLQTANEERAYLDALAEYRRLVACGSLRSEDLLNRFAPLRTGRCFKFGVEHGCKFRGLCFNQGVQPLAEDSGYVRRVPHHDTDHRLVA